MVGFMGAVTLFMAMISRSLVSHRGRIARDPSDMAVTFLHAATGSAAPASTERGRHSESEFT
jgi:hypothetical protein